MMQFNLANSDSGAIAYHENIDSILDHVARFQSPNAAQDDCTLLEIRYALIKLKAGSFSAGSSRFK